MKEIKIPTKIFGDRSFAVLESLVKYMKEELKMNYAEIAEILNRDERTIWTAYNRKQKNKK